MSASGRKKTIMWLLGFLTLLSILNVFNAIIELNGVDSTAYFRIFQLMLGSLDAETYFYLSLVIAFVFIGALSFYIFSGLPTDPELLQRFGKVEEILGVHSNMLENTQIGFFRKLEETEKANDEMTRKININLESMIKATSENLETQKAALQSMEEETRKNTQNIKKQAKEFTDLKKKITQLKKEETTQKAKLTGQTRLGKLRAITPRLETKLNNMNIMTVSDLLAADPAVVAERSAEMVETIANKQAEAQLLMVPGIDEHQAELLVSVGVRSQKELANQDPVHLYRGVVGIAKTRVEQGKMLDTKVPTIEDVSTWVKQARL